MPRDSYSGGWRRKMTRVSTTPGWVAPPSDKHDEWDEEDQGSRPPTIAPRTDPTPTDVLDDDPAGLSPQGGPGAAIPSQAEEPAHAAGFYGFGTNVGAWTPPADNRGVNSAHLVDDGWIGSKRRPPLEPGAENTTELSQWRPTLASPREQVFLGHNAYPENNQDDPRGIPEGTRVQRWSNRRMPRRLRRFDERTAGGTALAVSAKEGPSLWEQRAPGGQRYLTTETGSSRRRVTMTPILRRSPAEPSSAVVAEQPGSTVGGGAWQFAGF